MNRFSFLNQLSGQSAESVHGETVQYYRFGEHQPYDYTALIERQYDKIVREVGDISAPVWIVSIANTTSKEKGISPAEVNTDRDCVSVAIHPGEEPTMRQVVRILTSHAGRTRLLVS